ncbi:MAG TPA: hypothetical protein DCW29_18835 [Janthinobacterium sp.]|nr:hypothetical protein [Janthinobacterium sp.]
MRQLSPFSRKDITIRLLANGVECRPTVTGNFVKNEVIKYLDYEVRGTLTDAEYIDGKGFFVGNHQFDIGLLLKQLRAVLPSAVSSNVTPLF